MIAGIVAFVAVATTAVVGSPCGCSGSVELIRSSPIVSSFGSGSFCGSSVPVSSADVSTIGVSFGTPQIFSTESITPVTFVSPSVEVSAPAASQLVSNCESPASAGFSALRSSVFTPSVSISAVPSRIVSSGFCGGNSPSVSLGSGIISSGLYESPVTQVIASPVASPVMSSAIASPFLGSSCGSSSSLFSSALSSPVVVPSSRSSVTSFVRPVITSPAVNTVVSAPVVSSGVLGCGGLLAGSGCGC